MAEKLQLRLSRRTVLGGLVTLGAAAALPRFGRAALRHKNVS